MLRYVLRVENLFIQLLMMGMLHSSAHVSRIKLLPQFIKEQIHI